MSTSPIISVTITSDTKGVKTGTDSATTYFENFAKKTSGFLVGVGSKITEFGIGAAKNLLGTVGDMVNLGKQADLFDKKASTVFGGSAAAIKTWADSVNESFGMSDEAVVGMAGSMGDLLKPMGFTEQATADLTKKMLEQAGALSAWSGGKSSASEVSDIMTKALLGETEGLKGLGISITQAEIQQKAMAMTGKTSAAALTQQEKALATQQLMVDKSADAMKAWGDGTMDSVKKSNELKAGLDDAKTAIGEGLLPIVSTLTRIFVDDVIPAVRGFGDVIAATFGWLMDHKEIVIGALIGIGAVLVPMFITWAAGAAAAAAATLLAMTPILAIVVPIAAVAAGIIYAYTHVKIFRDIVDAVASFFKDTVWPIIQTIAGYIADAFRMWVGVVKFEIDIFVAVIETAISIFTTLKEWIGIAVDAIVGFVTGIGGRIAGFV